MPFDEVKENIASLIEENMGQVDLIIYSLASPMRIDLRQKRLINRSLNRLESLIQLSLLMYKPPY